MTYESSSAIRNRYLFNRLAATGQFDDVYSWPIGFITFNYDRSLEQFLFSAVKNAYGKDDTAVGDALRHIPFVHVHGHLGYLPWQREQGLFVREYEPTRDAAEIRVASKQIKILHEADETSAEFDRARQLLANADKIYVLGFGYHPTNVKRLNLAPGATRVQPVGTSCGLTNEEKESIARKGCCVGFPKVDDFGIIPFLRRSVGFLGTVWGKE